MADTALWTGDFGEQSPEAIVDAGVAASRSTESEQALRLFARASALSPRWAIPHLLMGSEYASTGKFDEAETALANAVLLDEELHIARYQLGLLQFSSGRPAAALVTWAPICDRSIAQGLPDLVRGFAALAGGHIEEAKTMFSTGLARPDVNAAVAGDVRKILGGLDSSMEGQQDGATDTVQEMPMHVLLSGYNQNKPH